jgi:signal transduction histidine kinase
MAHQFEDNDPALLSALTRQAAALELETGTRKRMEEALHEADRRRDEFLATLAHELRNPLAPMRNAIEIMRLAASDSATMAAARALIERQLDHLVRLIDDLLDVSRVTRGRLELRKQHIDLMTAVNMALETTRPLIVRKHHELHVEVVGEPLIVDGDVTRLSQVLATLIDNSALYSEPGGAITVALARDAATAVVKVSDHGIGIVPQVLPGVFDMFARPSPACIGARSGLGIGLTLVKRLVELHGGSIEAQSEGLNRGSTFTIRLPLAATVTDPTKGEEPRS